MPFFNSPLRTGPLGGSKRSRRSRGTTKMKIKMVVVISVAALLLTACFHASVNTDYASYSEQVVGNKERIPAVAALILGPQQRNREDHVVHLAVKVTIDTGTPLYEISKGSIERIFDQMIEIDSIDPTTTADILLMPAIDYLNTDVRGFAVGSYAEASGMLSLTAYDVQGKKLWSEQAPFDYRSGRSVVDLQLLIMRNSIATDAVDALLNSFKKLFNDFYASEDIQSYLCSISKCTPAMELSFTGPHSLSE